MRIPAAILLSIIVAIMVTGCGERAQRTRAVQVENPPAETRTSVPSQPAEPVPPAVVPPAKPAAKQAATPKGFIKTSSGLMYKDRKMGSGAAAKPGDTVTVHYKGWLTDGTVFDTSRKPGRGPFSFTLGQGEVIKGWDEGVVGMKPGGVRELIIPPALGYGDQDMGNIPPDSTLYFEVELLKIGR